MVLYNITPYGVTSREPTELLDKFVELVEDYYVTATV